MHLTAAGADEAIIITASSRSERRAAKSAGATRAAEADIMWVCGSNGRSCCVSSEEVLLRASLLYVPRQYSSSPAPILLGSKKDMCHAFALRYLDQPLVPASQASIRE